ncbi:replicative DNA helicase [Ktedonospora formicarum]|uniref:Replicative DNA helicase n=1 Tax=Ktedonospora formicarum TaxID=2778364 RepID=A0A8J3IDZ4_9CHLR|nr:replicative DNA helicase [Ktedonospora formicarum]GHO51435.1 replicative DNA helicase [Ktedonospora formicarum]
MAKQHERLLPHNVVAETAVLGSIIIDPEALVGIADFLRAEDFYRDAHRLIYEAMLDLYNRREQADLVTISDALQRRQRLEEVGGEDYLTSLISGVPTSANVVYYARIVERTAILRRLIHAAGDIAGMAYEAEEDATDVVDQAEQRIFEISQRAIQVASDLSISELLASYMARQEQLMSRGAQLMGVPSGFQDLDRLTGGFRKSDLIILAARPAVGKTSCALSLAYQAAVQYGQRIGIFSLEMSQEQLGDRLISIATGINLQRVGAGFIEDAEWEEMVKASETLSQAQIRIDGSSSLSPMQLRSRVRRWVLEEGIDLVIIDYLQLMQPSQHQKQENRVQVIDEISRELKILARELNIPILALAQLSRAVESRQSKVPQLSDLRESGGLEQNADLVIFIYRDEVYNPETERKGFADLIIAKHRNGPTGQVVLRFEAQTTRFRDLEEIDQDIEALVMEAQETFEEDGNDE